MNTAERLINLIIYFLNAPRGATLGAITRAMSDGYTGDEETVRRKFLRDKESLLRLGYPIVSAKISLANEHAYLLDPAVFLPPPAQIWEYDEERALEAVLAAAARSPKADDNAVAERAAAILNHLFPESADEEAAEDPAEYSDNIASPRPSNDDASVVPETLIDTPSEPALIFANTQTGLALEIAEAINQTRCLEFRYSPIDHILLQMLKTGRPTRSQGWLLTPEECQVLENRTGFVLETRQVLPLQLIRHGSRWFTKAWQISPEPGPRHFALDRIVNCNTATVQHDAQEILRQIAAVSDSNADMGDAGAARAALTLRMHPIEEVVIHLESPSADEIWRDRLDDLFSPLRHTVKEFVDRIEYTVQTTNRDALCRALYNAGLPVLQLGPIEFWQYFLDFRRRLFASLE